MRRLLRSTAIGLLMSPIAAHAHNVDCNNGTQPTQALSGCCGKEDYRALLPNEVRVDGIGFDVFLDGKWHRAMHAGTDDWLIAQPTAAACWGIWYRRGRKGDGGSEVWLNHDGNTEDYNFYCLEQPVVF